jgi:hypothetical protein
MIMDYELLKVGDEVGIFTNCQMELTIMTHRGSMCCLGKVLA